MRFDTLTVIAALWTAVTLVLTAILIYRSLVGMREDDQIFLSEGEEKLEREQLDLQSRLKKLELYGKTLGAVSGLLLVSGAGIWVYQQLTKTYLSN